MTKLLSAVLILCAAQAYPQWHRAPISETESSLSVLDLPGRIVVGTGKGLLASVDGGGSWKAFGQGLSAKPVSGMLEGPAGLIAFQAESMFISKDGGALWTPAAGRGRGDTLWSLEYRGDTLLALWGRYPPHNRSISFDAGQTWEAIEGTAWDPGPLFDTSDSGVRYRLLKGAVSRSFDREATWSLCPGTIPYGDVTGFSAAKNAYASTSTGNLIRSRDSGTTWQTVAVGNRPSTPVVLAADGKDVCYATKYGVYCSRDFGATFRFLRDNPWNVLNLGLSLGNGRVYISPKDVIVPKPVIVGDLRETGIWRTIPLPEKTGEMARLGSRDSTVLILRSHWDTVLISQDYGAGFQPFKAAPAFHGFVDQPKLGRNFWATPFGNLYYATIDRGRTWTRAATSPGATIVTGFAVSDSDAFYSFNTSPMMRNRFPEMGWTQVQLPAGDTALTIAAADTVLYVAVRGAILRQTLYGTTVGLPRPKAHYPTRRTGPALASPGRTPPPPWVDTRGRRSP